MAKIKVRSLYKGGALGELVENYPAKRPPQ